MPGKGTSGERKRGHGPQKRYLEFIVPDAVETSNASRRPRKTLVLSSGGLFGAYQAGVWRELEDVFEPDVVVGASIGSLNGWAIAGGATADQLFAWWQAVGSQQILGSPANMRLRVPRSWRQGVIDCRPLFGQIEKFHAHWRRRRDFAVVATSIPGFRMREFWNEQVTWRHLAASCAVPIVIDMQKIDGETLGDGGLLDHCPLAPALRPRQGLTPEVVVVVDVLPGWPVTPLKTAIKVMQKVGGYRPPSFNGTRVITIAPSGLLGDAQDSLYFDVDRNHNWFEQGSLDAARAKRLL
jgi:predicted acylesterase/phospholipase RssA